MKKSLAWVVVIVATLVALVLFGIVMDVGKHIYPTSNGARSDALYSLFIGVIAIILAFGVRQIWRSTRKARTGKEYMPAKTLTKKNIGKAGFTELMYTSSGGDMQGVTALLANGVDVNAQDEQGKTALMFAAMNDQAEVVKLLLQVGANTQLTTKAGNNAYWFAHKQGLNEIASLLKPQTQA